MVNKGRFSPYLLLTAVFVLGAAAGGAASYAYAQQRHAALFASGEDGRAAFENRRMRGMARKLELDEDQEKRISAILAKARDEARDVSRDMFEKCGEPIRAQRARVDAEIRAVLRPDQQQRYDELVDERREHLWLGPPMRPRHRPGDRH